MITPTERIGLILVHGIGEQRRFEHLEAHARPFIEALRRRPGAEVSVEILAAPGATQYSTEMTWSTAPSARISVVERDENDRPVCKEFLLHEVWWADVNEAYSILKQIRFWFWGLSIWRIPISGNSDSPGYKAMLKPEVPGFDLTRRILARLQLFIVSMLFLMAAASLGLFVVLAKRLLNFSPPDFVETIVNYVSGVKLYNQPVRRGDWFWDNCDFIDAMNEPPRVSIRRRMIETMVDAALQKYDRWYVLAHSLGSVVAFNGLMEPAESLAHYIDKARFVRLLGEGFAGSAAGTDYFRSQGVNAATTPRRRNWIDPNEIVFRAKVLEKFRGLLTYGSPLEKFAALWPARVPLNKEELNIPPQAEWINVYDPVDPVSGVLRAFSPKALELAALKRSRLAPANAFKPLNIGYAASRTLLYAHICYLQLQRKSATDLPDAIAEWTLKGEAFRVPVKHDRWYEPFGWRHDARNFLSGVEVVAIGYVLAVLGSATITFLLDYMPDLVRAAASTVQDYLEAALDFVAARPFSFVAVIAAVIVLCLGVDLVGRRGKGSVFSAGLFWLGVGVGGLAIAGVYIFGVPLLDEPLDAYADVGRKAHDILSHAGLFAFASAILTFAIGLVATPFLMSDPEDDGNRSFNPSPNDFGLRE